MIIEFHKTRVMLLVALTLGFAGCATAPPSQMSPAEAQLEQQSSWFSRTDVQGAVLGSLVGGGVCALAGGNLATCLASAAGGGLLGYSAGAYMNSLRANYATQETQLAKALSDIQMDNQRTASYVSAEQQVIQEKTARLEMLKQARANKTLSESQIKTELAALRATSDKLTKKASDLGQVQNKYEQTYKALNVRDQRMESQLAVMRQQTQTVNQSTETYKRQLDEFEITTGPAKNS